MDRAIEIDLLSEDAYYDLGTLNATLDRNEEAVAIFDKIIERNPRSVRAYDSRGIAKEKLGRYKEARADMKRVLELEPNNVDAPLLTLTQQKSEKTNSGSCPLVLIRLKPSEDRQTFIHFIQRLLQRMTN